MNKKGIYIGIAVVAAISISILVLSAVTVKRSEDEIVEIDEFIEEMTDVGLSVDSEDISRSDSRDVSDSTTDYVADADSGTDQSTEETLSAEELANLCIEHGINGDARKAELGDRYEEVQAWIDANYVSPTTTYTETYPSGGGVLTPSAGVNYYNGRMETYYNLPMGGVLEIMYSLGYSGEYWVRSDGVKMFGDYIMVACDFGEYPRGSIIETSLGTAIVCDTGSGGYGWTDIAVTW